MSVRKRHLWRMDPLETIRETMRSTRPNSAHSSSLSSEGHTFNAKSGDSWHAVPPKSPKKQSWTLHMPLWIQITVFLGFTSLVSLIVLAVVVIVKTTDYSRNMISTQLASYAAVQASMVEESLKSLQSDISWMVGRPVVTNVMQDRMQGNYSRAGYDEMATYIASMAAMKSYLRAFVVYDTSFMPAYSRQDASSDAPLTSLLPAMTDLLPLEKLNPDFLNTLNTQGLLVPPVPIVLGGVVASFALSLTIPLCVRDSSSRNDTIPAGDYGMQNYTVPGLGPGEKIVGYGTAVLTITPEMLGLSTETFLKSGQVEIGMDVANATDPSFTFVRVTSNETDSATYRYSTFPAMAAARDLRTSNLTGDRPSGSLLETKTIDETRASVGYSVAEMMGQRWFVCIELQRNKAYGDVNGLRNKLLGIVFGIFGLLLLLIIPLGLIVTNPLYKIYNSMELTPGSSSSKDPKPPQPKSRLARMFAYVDPRHLAPFPFVLPRFSRHSSSDNIAQIGEGEKPLAPDVVQTTTLPTNARMSPGQDSNATLTNDLETRKESDGSRTQRSEIEVLDDGVRSSNKPRSATISATSAASGDISSDDATPQNSSGGRPRGLQHLLGQSLFTKVTRFPNVLGSRNMSNNQPSSTVALDLSGGYQVPSKLPPLDRIYRDELDDLVDEYNAMVDKLNTQYMCLEDQVQLRTQEAQEARVLAEKANKAKSQFIANITHELRTPLNGIMGMTSVTLSENNLQRVKVSLQVIIDSGSVLMELLNELLAFSRLQIDLVPKLTEFTASGLLEGLENMYRARAESKNLSIAFLMEPPAIRNIKFIGDSHRISQIIGHVLSNAIKFSDTRGSISVKVRFKSQIDQHVSLAPYTRQKRLPPPLSMLEVAVTDAGVGFSEQQMQRVFEPFVQGDDAFNKKHQGTGLGMSMCKQLAELLGGYVSVWSAEGKGSCVVFRTPIRVVPGNTSSLLQYESHLLDLPAKELYFTSSVIAGTVRRVTPPERRVLARSLAASDASPVSSARSNPSDAVLSKRYSMIGTLINSFTATRGGPNAGVVDRHRGSFSSGNSGARSGGSHAPSHDGASMLSGDTSRTRKDGLHGQTVAPLGVAPESDGEAGREELSLEVPPPQVDFAAERRAAFLSKDHADIRVLVADDNDLNLQIMRRMLASMGVTQVETVSDGETVVEMVEKSIREGFHYTVIFVDLVMPKLNGLEATQIIRAQLGYPYPIVALTGYGDQQTQDMCTAANIQSVIVKPVMKNAVMDILALYENYRANE